MVGDTQPRELLGDGGGLISDLMEDDGLMSDLHEYFPEMERSSGLVLRFSGSSLDGLCGGNSVTTERNI